MAVHHAVTGDQMLSINGKIFDLERQLRLGLEGKDKSPLNPNVIDRCLQMLGEGVVLVPEKYTINCSVQPHIPDDWRIEPDDQLPGRITDSEFIWNPQQVKLWLSANQQGGTIKGEDLAVELKDKPVLPANVLEFLLENPHLIPDEWKQDEHDRTRFIYFWGTIYRNSDGDRSVRALCWICGQWHWRYNWLGNYWDDQRSGALRAT